MLLNDVLDNELEELKRKNLYRSLRCITSAQGPKVIVEGKEVFLFCSNNYLGLANHPRLIKASVEALKKYGTSSVASRLISGTMSLHQELEEKIAIFKGQEAGIIFSSGYMANLGVITAVVGLEDVIISDRLNHASLIDGCRLSQAKLKIYPHNDVEALEKILKETQNYRRRLIITDSIFSMDGDIAPLPEICKLAKKYNSYLMVDDAHATGVLGEGGRGSAEYFKLKKDDIDIYMGTFSKALGSFGGFITGSRVLINYLRNKARTFIYSTSLPPSVSAVSLEALKILENEPQVRRRLWKNVKYFRSKLENLGYNIMNSQTQIIPLLIKDNFRTMAMSKGLFAEGLFAVGIRPPSVPINTSRIRLSLMATHTKDDMDKAVAILKKVGKSLGII